MINRIDNEPPRNRCGWHSEAHQTGRTNRNAPRVSNAGTKGVNATYVSRTVRLTVLASRKSWMGDNGRNCSWMRAVSPLEWERARAALVRKQATIVDYLQDQIYNS